MSIPRNVQLFEPIQEQTDAWNEKDFTQLQNFQRISSSLYSLKKYIDDCFADFVRGFGPNSIISDWSIALAPYKINWPVKEGNYYYVSNIAANSDRPSTNYQANPGEVTNSWTRYCSYPAVVKVMFDLVTGQTPGV